MDKVSVNQQIVLMRNVVKVGQRRTYLELRKTAVRLKKKIKDIPEKEEKLKKTLDIKLRRINESLALIKSINLDTVSKEALKATEPWQKVLNDPKSSREQKLIARIANCCIVQKHVKKFREEHKDWQLYLSTLLELWDEKKKIRQNEQLPSNENTNQVMERFSSKPKNNESHSKPAKEKEKEVNNEKELLKKSVPTGKPNKRIVFSTESETVEKEKESSESLPTKTVAIVKESEAVQSNDDFFINKKSLFPSVVETTNQSDSFSEKNFKPKFKDSKYQKSSEKRFSEKPKDNWRKQKGNKNENESIHPSWQAKKQQKQIFKIDFNNSQAKKIRFTD